MDELADLKDEIEGMNDRIRYMIRENHRVHSICVDLARMETMRRNLKDALDQIAHLNDIFLEHGEAIDSLKEVKEAPRKRVVEVNNMILKVAVVVMIVVVLVAVIIYLFKYIS